MLWPTRISVIATSLSTCLLATLHCFAPLAHAKDDPSSSKGVVVCVSPQAAVVGADVLRQGGNAVDAAIATAFALAVTYPEAGNVGGGGYLLYCPSDDRDAVAFDFREVAPAAAKVDMFVRPEDRTPHRRVGVPGTVAGLALAHRELGFLSWAKLVEPAVALAHDGFVVDQALADSLEDGLAEARDLGLVEFVRVYGRPQGGPWRRGDRLVQPDLATALKRIAVDGPAGFYEGATAELLTAEMARGGGLITAQDLRAYRPQKKAPLRGTYRGYGILCMPPSSSGGTVLLEELNLLECFELSAEARWSPRSLHLLAEVMKRAYRDRAVYLGDPAFVEIPSKLTDKDYARKLAATIDLDHATPSRALAGDIKLTSESEHTTHLSIVDANGAAVSLTYTLETRFGSGVVVRGTGILLNDEMNDFVWVPGFTDERGWIGTAPNRIAPGKRMLSSMCPTIVTKGGKPVLVTGSPGGRTIINTVLGIIVNFIDFAMTSRQAVDAPRLHHQWFPDVIRIEAALAMKQPALVDALRALGHTIEIQERQGDAHTIWIDPESGVSTGVADHRISGKASVPRGPQP